MKQPTTPVYAVIRLDHDLRDLSSSGGATPQASVIFTVKEVLLSQERAEAEVERLNKLNSEKGCRYFWQYTRLVSDDEH
jgi:hypothetical protein